MLINFQAIAHKITPDELLRLSSDNPDTKFETTKEGRLIAMSPTGSLTGGRNADLLIQVGIWNRQNKLGKVFDSSTGFILSNGAVKSPDVSWIELSRWRELTPKQQARFAPIDPDFVIELRSPTDRLSDLQLKMVEYLKCGVLLGWLINPMDKQVEVYRQGQEIKVLDSPQSLSGENVCSGLIVDLADIF